MADYTALDRADNFLAAVSGWIVRRAASGNGVDDWNWNPAHRATRERATRLMWRAHAKREREIRAVERSGVPGPVVRAHVLRAIHQRERAAEQRTARPRASR